MTSTLIIWMAWKPTLPNQFWLYFPSSSLFTHLQPVLYHSSHGPLFSYQGPCLRQQLDEFVSSAQDITARVYLSTQCDLSPSTSLVSLLTEIHTSLLISSAQVLSTSLKMLQEFGERLVIEGRGNGSRYRLLRLYCYNSDQSEWDSILSTNIVKMYMICLDNLKKWPV